MSAKLETRSSETIQPLITENLHDIPSHTILKLASLRAPPQETVPPVAHPKQ